MRFSMMTVNGNCMLDACKNFIAMDLESIDKMRGMCCPEDCL